MSTPTLVGITGGIGAGKSIVSRIFQSLGTPVYDADSKAKWLMTNSTSLKQGLIALFGQESYTDNHLNRDWIASKVFHDATLLERLNRLVHPEVAKDFQKWCEEHASAPYLLKEAALLFETGSYKQLDHIILVTAPKEIRIERVKSRDTHRTAADIEAIIEKQLSDEVKIPLANSIVKNDGEQLLIPQILKLHEHFSHQ